MRVRVRARARARVRVSLQVRDGGEGGAASGGRRPPRGDQAIEAAALRDHP